MIFKNDSYVILLDYMGDDHSIISAARTSTKTSMRGQEADKRLLRHLWKNKHLSPFEQVCFTFHVKTPIFIARQIMRHRTGKFNETSARYKEMEMIFFKPDIWRAQNITGNKQGSSGNIPPGKWEGCYDAMEMAYYQIQQTYETLISHGVARELARTVLPVGMYTELVMTFDLRNLLHFIKLRIDEHAQPEIREVASQILAIIQPIVPWTVELFLEGEDE